MQHTVTAIAAISKERRALGYQNQLLWKIPGDLPRFKALTTGHPIIMGLNTFRSLPNALPNRTNIVMSDTDIQPPTDGEGTILVVHSPEEALEAARSAPGGEEIFIIGGGMVYAAMLPYTDELDLTIVDDEPEADVFFPDYSEFSEIVSSEAHTEGELSFTRVLLRRSN